MVKNMSSAPPQSSASTSTSMQNLCGSMAEASLKPEGGAPPPTSQRQTLRPANKSTQPQQAQRASFVSPSSFLNTVPSHVTAAAFDATCMYPRLDSTGAPPMNLPSLVAERKTSASPIATENTPLQRLGRPVQLCGNDAYTKSLMNRVATGQATADEQVNFSDYVRNYQRQFPSSAASTSQVPSSVAYGAPYGSGPPRDLPPLTTGSAFAVPGPVPYPFSHIGPFDSTVNPASTPSWYRSMGHPYWSTPQIPCTSDVPAGSTIPPRQRKSDSHPSKQATREKAKKYTKPFCDFLTENPTVFHAVGTMKKQLLDAGFEELSEREEWEIEPSGSYFVERNGSSLIAFTVGGKYEAGNGAAILAGHIDAITAKLKPISHVPNRAGYVQLGVAPYAGGLNSTWWDRDLGIGGRVLLKEGDKIVTKLVKLDWPIARIPTLAPHFGAAANGPFNLETQMVPIIGISGEAFTAVAPPKPDPFSQPPLLSSARDPVGSFARTQPPQLVKAISNALGLGANGESNIVNWELELFDIQPATVGGLDKEFIFAGRIDDKLCSWAALQALIESKDTETEGSSVIKVVSLFDDEEIGSLLRQGARGNFLPATLERAVGSLAYQGDGGFQSDIMGVTYANSFLVSSDVTHAVNPNFLGAYLENHAPHLNVGIAVAADPNGHMTTDAISTAILQRCADKVGAQLQVFQIRNDSRSGGTVGPMLSSATGIRAIDAGLPQLSMHSIRATTGALDPGLGVHLFAGFLNNFEDVDREFQA